MPSTNLKLERENIMDSLVNSRKDNIMDSLANSRKDNLHGILVCMYAQEKIMNNKKEKKVRFGEEDRRWRE